MVCHKYEFIQLESGVNTQTMERQWLEAKTFFRRRGPVRGEKFEQALMEYHWFRSVRLDRLDTFEEVLRVVRQKYSNFLRESVGRSEFLVSMRMGTKMF